MRRRSIILAILLMAAIRPGMAFAGYTQYFDWKIDPKDPQLSQCVTEMNLLINARKGILKLMPPDPKFQGNDAIHFNGIGDNEMEDFVFPGYTLSLNTRFGDSTAANFKGQNFCKTERKPYDEVVAACLLVARDHFTHAELQISSDGDWQDWQAGRALYERVLQRTAHNPMDGVPAVTRVPLRVIPETRPMLIALALVAVVLLAVWSRKGRNA